MSELSAALEELAPIALAEPWDSVGLQIGAPGDVLASVLLTVDVTRQVVAEAARKDAGAIVSHHPVLLGEVGTLRRDRWPGCVAAALIEARRSLYVAHTNLDWAPDTNTSAALAESLGLQPWEPLQARGEGFLGVVANGKAVVAGAAKGLKEAVLAAGVTEVICGEMGHHARLELAELGVTTVELGHAASEWPAMVRLAGLLQRALGETAAVEVSETGRE